MRLHMCNLKSLQIIDTSTKTPLAHYVSQSHFGGFFHFLAEQIYHQTHMKSNLETQRSECNDVKVAVLFFSTLFKKQKKWCNNSPYEQKQYQNADKSRFIRAKIWNKKPRHKYDFDGGRKKIVKIIKLS